MEPNASKASSDAIHAAEGGLPNRLLELLAERIGGRASVKAVFGEPVRTGDLTVIPVARIRWGIGGGGGRADAPSGADGSGSGGGGGGGVSADPVGYLEIRPDGATFRPITSPYPSPLLVLAGGLALSIVLRALLRAVGR